MTDFDAVDFFTSKVVAQDPYPFFEYLRSKGPVHREPHHGVVVVTGYEEAVSVYDDHRNFSSCNAVTGPFPFLPFTPEGNDISALIEKYRPQMSCNEFLVTQDPPRHTVERALLMRLFTPRRLQEVGKMMLQHADHLIDEICARRQCELVSDYAHPFATLIIADLLGVPGSDLDMFRERLSHQWKECSDRTRGLMNRENLLQPLEFLKERFTAYLEERQRIPRRDILTELVNANLPDGTKTDIAGVVRLAIFLFAAGQDTSALLIASAFRVLGEQPDLQKQLRQERHLIPGFIEEVLRLESPIKSVFRLARVSTTVGDIEVPAGTTVMILPGAANRDPRRFALPDKILLNRPRSSEHLSFGRGTHICAGRLLARAETRITIERILDRVEQIEISTDEHGLPGMHRYDFDSTYILRKLNSLHLELKQKLPGRIDGRASYSV